MPTIMPASPVMRVIVTGRRCWPVTVVATVIDRGHHGRGAPRVSRRHLSCADHRQSRQSAQDKMNFHASSPYVNHRKEFGMAHSGHSDGDSMADIHVLLRMASINAMMAVWVR
jgi:hypothetical protein